MPFAIAEDARIYWRLQGKAGCPVLVLLHGIGTDQTLFDRLVPHLVDRFQLLRIDFRGHGASDATAGDYTLAMLARDVVAVMDAAEIADAVLCGVSLGGMVAMELALLSPERVAGMVLACTSAAMDAGFWGQRVALVRENGVAAIADAAVSRVMSPAFTTLSPGMLDSARNCLRTMASAGYAGCGAAIRDMDLLARISQITAPVLVLAGRVDEATPYAAHGERIAVAIPAAGFRMLEGGHWTCLERPAAFADALQEFAASLFASFAATPDYPSN